MRRASWLRWFNSFGFITVVIFSFAFLTTMDFSSDEGKRRLPMPSILAKSESGRALDRSGLPAAAQYSAAGAPFYLVHPGSRTQTYAYKGW
jgi:hypothetical protein